MWSKLLFCSIQRGWGEPKRIMRRFEWTAGSVTGSQRDNCASFPSVVVVAVVVVVVAQVQVN